MLIFLCVLLTLAGLAILWFGHLEFKKDREEREAARLKREKLEQERRDAAEAAKKRRGFACIQPVTYERSYYFPPEGRLRQTSTKPSTPVPESCLNQAALSNQHYSPATYTNFRNDWLDAADLYNRQNDTSVSEFIGFSGGDSGGGGASDSWASPSTDNSSSSCDSSSSYDSSSSCDTSSYSSD
jgi:hypothetical protein